MRKLVFFILLSVFFCPVLYSQESEETTKKIEKKWGWEEGEKKPVIKKEVTIDNPIPLFLTQFQPQKQEFSINPTMENIIQGKFGTKITIPANSISLPTSYKRGDILTLELIEVYNDLDFITAGIDLYYFNPNPNIFESAGMFKLTASYYDKPLYLKRGVKLKVEIPSLIYSNRKMKMYKLDEREGWIEKGSLSAVEEVSDTTGENSRSNLVFRAMDDFKWWNADYPNPDTTCLEGKVIPLEVNPPNTITSVGIDYKNASTSYLENNKFQINAIKGKRIKLIVMDTKGNIGLSPELDSGTLTAFVKPGDKVKCTDIGTIEIKKIPREILRDRAKMLQHLGLYDIITP